MFKTFDDVLNYRGHRIITKRIEPYDVIESAKKFYDVKEYIFTGRDKFEKMDEFLNELSTKSKTTPSMGLYMKNVNKFYLLSIKENPENSDDLSLLHNLLISKEYGFSEDEQLKGNGIIYSTDTDFALEQIDMGKAEASFIIL